VSDGRGLVGPTVGVARRIDTETPSPAARLSHVTRRLVALLFGVIVLSACRLDVVVSVEMEPDGTGVVTVDAVADAELVAQVPELVDDLRLDDAEANGWIVEGPIVDDAGNLSITLTHAFASATELANVLNSIGPPLTDMAAARTFDEVTEQTTNAVDGTLTLQNGFDAFADAELVAAVGGLPFGEEIAASGLTPAEAMSFTYRVSLPGELVASEGVEVSDGVIEWTAALDGSSADLLVQTVQRPPGSGNSWAGPLSSIAFILLIAWVVVAAVFIAFVAYARHNKRRRRERALSHLR
jgi:hypothetical protein